MVQGERDMSEVPERRMRPRWVGLGMAGMLPSGARGLRATLRTSSSARSACIALGLDAVWADRRLVADGRPRVVNNLRVATGIQGRRVPEQALRHSCAR
jgi:hypothetical protein